MFFDISRHFFTIRDFINGTLNKGLVSAIENEMAIETVSEGIALEIKKSYTTGS